MADPLTLLRDFNLRKQLDRVHTKDDRVNFGDSYSFERAAFIAFRNSRDRDFYSLEAALFMLKNRTLPQAEYIKQASVNRITRPVSIIDRKKLLDFLDGLGDLQLEALPDVPFVSASATSEDGFEPASKRARHAAPEDSAITSLLAQERQLRTRNTMLLAPNRNFQKVLDLLVKAQNAKRQEQQNLRAATRKAVAPVQLRPQARAQAPAPAQPAGLPVKASNRFERDATQAQLQEMAGTGAGNFTSHISMYGYKAGGSSEAAPPPPPPPPPPPLPSQPSSSLRKALPPPPPSGGSSKPAHVLARPSNGVHASSSGNRPASVPAATAAAAAAHKKGGIPIILVPSGMTALLNMYNAQQFFQEGRFELSDDARKRGVQKQPILVVDRTVGRDKPVKYHIIDKPPAKGHKDWERVVAVVAQGANWQFREFPHKGAAEGDLSETFHKVCGFYLHWADLDKVAEPVASWNVKRLGVHRENRHSDTTVVRAMFAHLDQFLLSRKCSLTY